MLLLGWAWCTLLSSTLLPEVRLRTLLSSTLLPGLRLSTLLSSTLLPGRMWFTLLSRLLLPGLRGYTLLSSTLLPGLRLSTIYYLVCYYLDWGWVHYSLVCYYLYWCSVHGFDPTVRCQPLLFTVIIHHLPSIVMQSTIITFSTVQSVAVLQYNQYL